ncbi:MAG: U32 family peptidase [Clostridiales bacterium]|nr:U32 family peptidase [Clostridiales bacterium]
MYTCDSNKEIPSYFAQRDWIGEKSATQQEKIEILAPASANSYKNAVYNGADAIYFGYKELNARAKGENFNSIKEVTDFCHLFGVKAYLALNIAVKNKELSLAREIIKEAEKANIDAFIISDLALVPIIKRYSSAEIHASTQMGVHNVYGVKFLERFGFDRVVLSREVTLDEIKRIKQESDIEIEVFAHGALCVAFSGACLLSSITCGNSGNRGRCRQLCRHFFTCYINGNKMTDGYLLSAKDIKMLDHLAELKQARVDSLKIEGRLRRPEYVGGVTNIYKYYSQYPQTPTEDDENTLKLLYNRGNFTTLYLGERDIISPHIPDHIGIPFGEIIEVRSPNSAVAVMKCQAESGDGFKIIREKEEVSGAVVKAEIGNCKYIMHTENPVNIGDIALLTNNHNLSYAINNIIKKISIDVVIRLFCHEKPHIIASANGATIELYGEEIIPKAKSNPVTEQDIKEQFSKTNNTNFEFNFLFVLCQDAFMTKAQLNSLRRQTIAKMELAIIDNYNRKPKSLKPIEKFDAEKVNGDFAEFNSLFIPDSVYSHINNIVYNPDDLNYQMCLEFYKKTKKEDNLVFIKPPIFMLESKFSQLEKIGAIFDGIVADNLAYVELGKALGKKIVGGINLNITNTKNSLTQLCNQFIASIELNKRELASFKGALLYTYGNLPLMHLNHCPRLLAGQKCGRCGGQLIYKDKKGQYEIVTKKFYGYCQHQLKNGVITNLGNFDGYYKYFDFTSSTTSEIDKVLHNYYVDKEFSTQNYNHLHLTRGVK